MWLQDTILDKLIDEAVMKEIYQRIFKVLFKSSKYIPVSQLWVCKELGGSGFIVRGTFRWFQFVC